MNTYVAWLELVKKPAGFVLGSPNPRLTQELEENRMIIMDTFPAENDEHALATARRTVEQWPESGWTERRVVKIWEVSREVPVE